jgi:FtsP/CotA-like multicopper oxidase with cupredoxin domain
VTFDASLPHVTGSMSGAWQGKTPNFLCEVHPVDEEGNLRSPFNAGDVPNIMTGPPVGEGQTVLTNGVNVGASTLNVQAGQGLRLQIINAAATRYMRLRLTDGGGNPVNLVRIGGQGGLLDNSRLEGGQFNYNSGEILIPPGSREDVVAEIPSGLSDGHVLTLWTQDYQRTGGTNNFAWIPTVPVMHLKVNGAAGQYTLAPGTPLRLSGNPVADLCQKVNGVCTVSVASLQAPPDSLPGIGPDAPVITFTNSGGLGVNDIQGEHDHSTRPASARYARIGDTLELKVTNTTGAHHPFHLHGFSFQPISLTKGMAEYNFGYNEYRDEIDIPAGYTLTFRVRLDDRPNFYDDKGKVLEVATLNGGGLGRWLFHCHILFHSTLGMISELDVVPATN